MSHLLFLAVFGKYRNEGFTIIKNKKKKKKKEKKLLVSPHIFVLLKYFMPFFFFFDFGWQLYLLSWIELSKNQEKKNRA
jgi:hypothetical protein